VRGRTHVHPPRVHAHTISIMESHTHPVRLYVHIIQICILYRRSSSCRSARKSLETFYAARACVCACALSRIIYIYIYIYIYVFFFNWHIILSYMPRENQLPRISDPFPEFVAGYRCRRIAYRGNVSANLLSSILPIFLQSLCFSCFLHMRERSCQAY